MIKKEKFYLIVIILFCIFSLFLLLKTEFIEKANHSEIKCKDCNVILIIIDALRPDHLGCYGYYTNTSSKIDKFAAKSILFTQAFSQSSWTLPSMYSIFTSFYPYLNYENREQPIPKSIVTLPEILKEDNYKTVGFTSSCYSNSYFGFSRGFDNYDDRGCLNSDLESIESINKRVFEFLDKNYQNNFFIYLHVIETHGPYGNKTGQEWHKMNLSLEKNKNDVIKFYDENVFHVDANIGELLIKLEDLNLTQKTIVVITSDHGQHLFDRRDGFGHGGYLYDEEIHVPLIIYIPKFKHKIINQQVSHIDLMPTILDMLSIPISKQVQGSSLFNLITDKEQSNRTIYSLLEPLISMRKENFKLIYNRKSGAMEFYNLHNDPKEKLNLIKENLTAEKDLEIELRNWLQEKEEIVKSLNITLNEFNYPETIVPAVDINITQLSVLSTNPDIIYYRNEWSVDGISFNDLSQDFWGSWYSDGWYFPGSIPENSEHKGIVLIHPKNFTEPRFLAQNISFGNDVYVLVAEYGNVASYFNSSCDGGSDAIIKIKILDHENGEDETIFEDIIKETDGWKRVSLVVHSFRNKNITFKIEGYAGGEGTWCGEFAAVNKFYIGKLTDELKINQTSQQEIEEKLRELGYIN